MRDSKVIFRYLWRFNAALYAVLGLAAVTVLLSLVFQSLFDRAPRAGIDYAPVSVAHGYTYRLSRDPISLGGAQEKLFALERWKGTPAAPGSSGVDVNLLVVNGSHASSHWMFPGNAQTILARDPLRGDGAAYAPVEALVLTVLESDGSGKARESLYCYRIGGPQAVRFFTADTIMAAQQIVPDRYLVIYRNGKNAASEVFSMIDFHVVSKSPLPDVP